MASPLFYFLQGSWCRCNSTRYLSGVKRSRGKEERLLWARLSSTSKTSPSKAFFSIKLTCESNICGCGVKGNKKINDFSQNPISSAFKGNLSSSQFAAISFWSQADQEQPIARVLGSSPWKTYCGPEQGLLRIRASLTSTRAPICAASWTADKTSSSR